MPDKNCKYSVDDYCKLKLPEDFEEKLDALYPACLESNHRECEDFLKIKKLGCKIIPFEKVEKIKSKKLSSWIYKNAPNFGLRGENNKPDEPNDAS